MNDKNFLAALHNSYNEKDVENIYRAKLISDTSAEITYKC
jgi:hypothetical protein